MQSKTRCHLKLATIRWASFFCFCQSLLYCLNLFKFALRRTTFPRLARRHSFKLTKWSARLSKQGLSELLRTHPYYNLKSICIKCRPLGSLCRKTFSWRCHSKVVPEKDTNSSRVQKIKRRPQTMNSKQYIGKRWCWNSTLTFLVQWLTLIF